MDQVVGVESLSREMNRPRAIMSLNLQFSRKHRESNVIQFRQLGHWERDGLVVATNAGESMGAKWIMSYCSYPVGS